MSEIEWRYSPGLSDYPETVAAMEARVADIAAGTAPELIWLLEHPPLYTSGTSADVADLIDPDRFPVFAAQRGGQYTYHGPGQRVIYVMLDLNKRGRDVRKFVQQLEAWVIKTLSDFDIHGQMRCGRVGVWVPRKDKPKQIDGSWAEDKIAAIGIRLRKWVSFHGISINHDPELSHFDGIVPCGITQHGVTSFKDLGRSEDMTQLDQALRDNFTQFFALDPDIDPSD